MTAPPSTLREYDVAARTTDVFGRVLCNARTHHFIIDGPVQNGCPGEELTPPEIFLSGVASCGVELVQVIARETNVKIGPSVWPFTLSWIALVRHARMSRSSTPYSSTSPSPEPTALRRRRSLKGSRNVDPSSARSRSRSQTSLST